MRVVLQRVKGASVSVYGKVVGEIGRGLVLLMGVKEGDGEKQALTLAEKCLNLRVFEDEKGKMNLSVRDIGGEILAVSQFTLYGDCRKGRRPSFVEAAPPQVAAFLYNKFIECLSESGLRVEKGVFGAKMLVNIQNDGPVTLVLES
ncbi:D-tyrosyl-tRNA(Tyr) deacylase [candidate division KSB1 bacterium]|nr:D-tyrosyl-tRNA(Tyr) deacylase [candidate division KSB1 bacterium]